MKKIISVVVGLVFNSRQEVLLAWRDEHKTPGDCWEFPGGKIEAGESNYQALCRELQEEIAIDVLAAQNLPCIDHEYESVCVILYPWKIEKFNGIPKGNEGQIISWVPVSQLRSLVLPAANHLIVDALFDLKN